MKSGIAAIAIAALFSLPGGVAEAQNCGYGPFKGFYIGANLGMGRLDALQSSPGELTDASGHNASVVGGGQLGYNWQCNDVVFGIETDFNYARLNADSGWSDPIYLKDKVGWFGTTRGRLGWMIHEEAMLYVTGGLAYADVSRTLTDPALSFTQTNSGFKTGWTIGGGLEVAATNNWLLRAEVLYIDLGSSSQSYTTVGCVVCTGQATWEESFWVGRLGVSYRFDAPRAPVVEPLK
jgi:outer membrane immunogenic protein